MSKKLDRKVHEQMERRVLGKKQGEGHIPTETTATWTQITNISQK